MCASVNFDEDNLRLGTLHGLDFRRFSDRRDYSKCLHGNAFIHFVLKCLSCH